MAGGYRGNNSTANNALKVLNLFTADRKTITAIQIANHLQTSRSTAYRYLDTLLEMNFLAEDPTGGYRIGPRIQELAMLDLATDRALELIRPWVTRLRDEFNETTTYTARLGGLRTVIRASEGSHRLLTVNYPLGTVMPLYAGAPSLVLMITDTEDQISKEFNGAEPVRHTPTTPVTVAEILPIVDRIRRDGYYVSRGEYDPDLVSVGVPIFTPEATRPIGGLGTVLPSSRTSPAVESAMVNRLLEAAASVKQAFMDPQS